MLPMQPYGMVFPSPVPDQVWQEMMLQGSATQLLLGGVEGVGLPSSEAASFPLPSGSLSQGGGLLKGEQRRQRIHDLDTVAFGLSLQQSCGERMHEEPFAPFPLLIPFGWRPDPVIQDKKAPLPRRSGRANPTQKVFIGGLSTVTTEEDLRSYFGTFGTVASVDILVDQETQKSRGFGFVVFEGQVPDGVLGCNHCFHGRYCGTRMYDQGPSRPDAYRSSYLPNMNIKFDRYAKGKGKGESDADAGKGFRNTMQGQQRPRRRVNGAQSRDPPAAQCDGLSPPAEAPAEAL